MPRVAFRVAPAGIAAAAALGVAAVPAGAAEIKVQNANDSGPNSLRAAITQANLTLAVEDRLIFPSTLTGKIELATPLPDIKGPLDIDGPGAARLSIDGNGDGIFYMHQAGSAYNAPMSISGLTLTGGRSDMGGAIDNRAGGDLTVSGVSFVDNEASNPGQEGGGAIAIGYPGNTLDVTDSDFSGNYSKASGGAVSALYSDVTISGSTFNLNTSVGKGGAVFLEVADATVNGSRFTSNQSTDMTGGAMSVGISGKVAISESEFTGNSSKNSGAVIRADAQEVPPAPATIDITGSTFDDNEARSEGSGGVVVLGGFTTRVTNSTLTGNRSRKYGSAIMSVEGPLAVESSTITGNTIVEPVAEPSYQGAGVFGFGSTNVVGNSIVTGNLPADLSTLPGETVSTAFSLVGNPGNAGVIETVAGSNLAAVDPQLGPLADNGGPVPTRLPASTSPVINKGSSALTTDQRGLARPVNFRSIPFSAAVGANGADIGAVEVQGGPLPAPAIRFGKLRLNRKKGIATLAVTANRAGSVKLVGTRQIVARKANLKAAGTARVTVKARGKAAKKLRKKGRARVRTIVRFTAGTGTGTVTKSRQVTLKKNPGK